jgi:hypothetical protein
MSNNLPADAVIQELLWLSDRIDAAPESLPPVAGRALPCCALPSLRLGDWPERV